MQVLELDLEAECSRNITKASCPKSQQTLALLALNSLVCYMNHSSLGQNIQEDKKHFGLSSKCF